MKSETADVTIIGGGIIGASCAFYLCDAGLTVNMLERRFPASGTSRASDGLILLWDKASATELELAKISAQLWQELSETFVGQIDYARQGTLLLADTETALVDAKQTKERMLQVGIDNEWLDGTDLLKLEKNLAPDLLGGVFFPDDARVDARKATLAMIRYALRAGLNVYGDSEVTEVNGSPGGGSWQISTKNSIFESGMVVCAAGVWSGAICASIGLSLPTRPRKGHILVTERSPGLISHPMLEGGYSTTVHSETHDVEVAFVAEMTEEGAILVGSSRQFVGFDRRVSPPIVREIAARAVRFVPKMRETLCIRSFAGLRPWSPDHLPLIGPFASVPDFYLATGHEGAGIGLAPVTGKMISDWILGVERTSLMTQVSPTRFVQ